MSKKTLLEENAVRKMMKFANIGKLADGFVNENYGMYKEEEKEMMEAAHEGDEMPPEAGEEDEMLPPEAGMEEPEDEMPAEEEGAMGMDEKEQMLADVVAAVADTLGVEAAVEGAEAAPEGEEEAMDFAPAVVADEEPADDEEVMEMGHKSMEEGKQDKDDDKEVVEEVEVIDEESVVAETVKRVTARLKAMKEEKSKEDLVETITNRIIASLKKDK